MAQAQGAQQVAVARPRARRLAGRLWRRVALHALLIALSAVFVPLFLALGSDVGSLSGTF